MHRTEFDITVTTGRRRSTFHVTALNDLAKTARHFTTGDRIELTGYLHAEPFDMPDRTTWHRVEIIAYEIDHHPTPATATSGAQR